MAEWYYAADRKQLGPVSLDELQRLAHDGLLKPTDLVWQAGMSDWARANTRRELFADLSTAGAILPPPPLAARVVEITADTEPPRGAGQSRNPDRSGGDLYDDNGDRPGRRRRTRSHGPVGVRIGLIVGSTVLMLLIVGLVLFFLLRPISVSAPIAAGIGNFPGLLTGNDQPDQVAGGPSRVHMVHMIQGRTYIIELGSQQFDSFLRVEDSAFRQLAQDDNSGGGVNGLDARIVFTCPITGSYRVIAASLGPQAGAYALSIREQ
jgi:hypothetical protein